MPDWPALSSEIERLLRLRTYPVAYKKLDRVEQLDEIPRVRRLNRGMTFCQAPTLVRRGGWTVGITREDLGERCARLNGLAATTEEEKQREAENFSNTWYATVEEARNQMEDYPLMPPGEAVVLAPLAANKVEDPDAIMVYGNPAQLMLLMNALQFRKHRRFQFHFIGEGACADGLAQCCTSGDPALAIPCFGERRFGSVTEDELVLVVPPVEIERAVDGLQGLWQRGLRYPIMYFGPENDPTASLAKVYPPR